MHCFDVIIYKLGLHRTRRGQDAEHKPERKGARSDRLKTTQHSLLSCSLLVYRRSL